MFDEEYISKKDGKYLIKREFDGVEYFFGEFLTIDEAISKKEWLNCHGWPVSLELLENEDSVVSNEFTDLKTYDSQKFNCNMENNSYKQDILNLANDIKFIDEDPKIPFPQADDLNRFIFICQHLMEKDLSKEEIKDLNQIHDRIVSMYVSVGMYFKVFEKYKSNGRVFCSLNERGKFIFKLDEYNRNMGICYCILEHKIFNEIFFDCLSKNKINIEDIVDRMLNYDLNLNSMVTIRRRAQCVSSWMHWMFNLINSGEKQTVLD